MNTIVDSELDSLLTFWCNQELYKKFKIVLGGYIKKKALRNQFVAVGLEIGRNDPCLCGSGKKYKQCCLK